MKQLQNEIREAKDKASKAGPSAEEVSIVSWFIFCPFSKDKTERNYPFSTIEKYN